MRLNLLRAITLPLLLCCTSFPQEEKSVELSIVEKPQTIAEIALPSGYERVKVDQRSFGEWLRQIRFKEDDRVFLYNGKLKANQSAHFGVLNIPTGKKDLQQCADAVMRLRAEYLYSQKRFHEISFSDNNGKRYICPAYVSKTGFEKYLEQVYVYCGTYSLEKQLRSVANFNSIRPGDVLIKGGSPGHAVIVMDVAVNKNGGKLYLIAQSYMPAQDIHVLKNPVNEELSPWYEVTEFQLVTTPEWVFEPKHLRRW